MRSTREHSDVFAAISDPTRREILLRLAREGERNVTELMQRFSITQPAVSKHLRLLRESGLVQSRKAGRERLYQINPANLRNVYDWVAHFEKFWDRKLDALGEYLDNATHNKPTT